MKRLALLAGMAIFAASSAALALDGKLAADLAKELSNGCKSELPATAAKLGSQDADVYCQCYGREVALGMNEADFVALAEDRETGHFTALGEESGRLCAERHLIPATQERLKRAEYEDLPDISGGQLARTKSGVFAAKAEANLTVVADTEQAYVVKAGELICGWGLSPLEKQTTREALNQLKSQGPEFAKLLLKSSDAVMSSFEESKARGYPAAFMEMRGTRASIMGNGQETVLLYGTVLDSGNNAMVHGYCFADSARYEKSKMTMKRLATAALPSRRYKN